MRERFHIIIPENQRKASVRVLLSHAIFTTYGFWLPNDPRGSWSDFVGAWELLRFGPATKASTRKSVAANAHDVSLRLMAKRALKYEPVLFTGIQARAVGRGFAQAAMEGEYPIHACSILPDHIHMAIGWHSRKVERIVGHLKGRAAQALRAAQIHPYAGVATPGESLPSVWAEGMWKVFCFDTEHANNAIEYVKNNPPKEGKPPQKWSFVTPYVG